MSISLNSQHLALFSVRATSAADITADQRNIFDRPVTLAQSDTVQSADQGTAIANPEESSEWLRKTETYRSAATSPANQNAAPVASEPAEERTVATQVQVVPDRVLPASQPVDEPVAAASQPVVEPVAKVAEPTAMAATAVSQQTGTSNSRGLLGLLLRW